MTDAHNVGEVEELEDQDVQSHSTSSPSKTTSILEPIIEENAIEVDSTLDDLLNIETEQNPPVTKEQVGVEVVTDTSTPMPLVETNIVEESTMEVGEGLQRETNPLDASLFFLLTSGLLIRCHRKPLNLATKCHSLISMRSWLSFKD
ncbi:hypothetical protein GYH30_001460 [Glycine max]|nr:hypothetical protein GYH30_001460 [Glycine max]